MSDNRPDLFVEPIDEETKIAKSGLPVDTEEWPATIKEELTKSHPFLEKYNIKVNIKNTDEKSQSAIGAVTVSADDNVVHVPLIIEEGKIKPFDVMIYEGEVRPLTKKHVQEIFQNFDISSELADDDETSDYDDMDMIYDEQLQTPDSAYGLSGSVRTASAKPGKIIESLDGLVRDEDLEKISKQLDDDRYLASFAGSDGADVVENAIQLEASGQGGVTPGALLKKFAESDVFLCKEASPNEVEIISTPGHVFYPESTKVSVSLAKETVKKAGYDPKRLDDLSPSNDVVFAPENGPAKEAESVRLNRVESPGKYELFTKSGEKTEGYVFPDVFNYDNEKTDAKLAVANGSMGYQDEIVGHIKEQASESDTTTPPASDMKEGDTGFFYYNESGRMIATEPFDIEEIVTVDDRKAIYAESMSGKRVRLLITPNINGITKMSDPEDDNLSAIGKTVYLIPEKMTYVSVEDKAEFIDRPEENPEVVKSASQLTLRYDDGTNRFSINGTVEEVYELPGEESDVDCGDLGEKMQELDNLERSEVEFILGTLGVPSTKTQELISSVRKDGTVKVAHEQRPAGAREAHEKSAKVVDFIKSRVDKIRHDVVKEAAIISQNADEIKKASDGKISDKSSVDALLSLSLVREENLKKYLDEIDTYEEVVQDLSELLLLSRIGANNLPEEAIRNAIKSLSSVLDGLHELEAIFA